MSRKICKWAMLVLVAGCILMLAGIIGCESSSGSVDIVMQAGPPPAFNPQIVHVDKGTTITWTNLDTVAHEIRPDIMGVGPDSLGPVAPNGGQYTWTVPLTAGSGDKFYYHELDAGDAGEPVGVNLGTGMSGGIIVN